MNPPFDSGAPPPHAKSSFSGDVETVELHQDHPGFNDAAYRARRNEIAGYARRYAEGLPLPVVDYAPVEQGVWREVWKRLAPLHARLACREYLEGTEIFGFDHDRIPSFTELNERLVPLQGFELAPVPGLVLPVTFLRELGHRRFLATQYMRHHSQPLYTPEPDVVHEFIGHVPCLAHPGLAELNAAFGEATQRAERRGGEAARAPIEAMIRVYWYTIEFGLLEQDGEVKVWGAGTMSSVGELERSVHETPKRPWDLEVIAHTDYDPTTYQRFMFVAPPFARLRDELLGWLEHI